MTECSEPYKKELFCKTAPILLFLRIKILPIRNDVIDTRPEREDYHKRRGEVCEWKIFCHKFKPRNHVDKRLDDYRANAGYLCAGLYLAKPVGGNYNAA